MDKSRQDIIIRKTVSESCFRHWKPVPKMRCLLKKNRSIPWNPWLIGVSSLESLDEIFRSPLSPMPGRMTTAAVVSNILTPKKWGWFFCRKNLWICWEPHHFWDVLRLSQNVFSSTDKMWICFGGTWRLRFASRKIEARWVSLRSWKPGEAPSTWRFGNGIIQDVGDIPIQEILFRWWF